MRAGRFVADLDSSAALLRALAAFLHGRDAPALGAHRHTHPLFEALVPAVNRLSVPLRESAWVRGALAEALTPKALARFDAESLARWVVSRYPRRRYPAAVVGATNGALVHLCAALGIPWLPQTHLLSVRHDGQVPVDEPMKTLGFAREPARRLLESHPDLQLHHTHDANHDRLLLQGLTHFRVKRRGLSPAYLRFLEQSLEPGATLFVSECELRWPTLQQGERHVFQQGSLGGASPDEYYLGGPRVEAYLRKQGASLTRWPSPPPDSDSPEAEWGFEPALRDDLLRLARKQRWRLKRIVYPEPEALSPLVADLYRHWYRERRVPSGKLLAECSILLEPWWTLRTGAVPFWMVLNTRPSARALERYLDRSAPWDAMYLTLCSRGVESIGLATMEHWRELLSRGRTQGQLLGVDEREYPRDFASFVRYHPAMRSAFSAHHSTRERLRPERLDAFLGQHGERYAVQWLEADVRPRHQSAGATASWFQ
ncbi:hypothetical protein LXT21_08045 [Myxococcus sp. K38C18041901]|uniref:hypothetical protein n=1 Tax=Myxococcus guangdongensis TaxID=2906760 RepID=UPI0020A7E880|nr:hypothetical protein [Myxococcus guangdongensis]MCP3058719.1 hypothetical protein [Myxococcus guangdongensis]